MSPKENLHKLIDQLPEDKAEELERLVVQMLREGVPTPDSQKRFEEAKARTFATFDKTLRRLAE